MPDVARMVIREAVAGDLPALIAIFAADALGGHGDTTDPQAYGDYLAAFEAIDASANDCLYVAELDGEIVGTFQTTLCRSLSGRGAASMIVEAVQTHPDYRSRGIGKVMIETAIEAAKTQDCRLIQLSSNAVRKDAHRFYQRLGFTPSHIGFKLKLK